MYPLTILHINQLAHIPSPIFQTPHLPALLPTDLSYCHYSFYFVIH